MSITKLKLFSFLAGLAVMSSVAGATVYPVAAGETLVVDLMDPSGANAAKNVIDLASGSTLRLVNDLPSHGFAMYSMATGAPAAEDRWPKVTDADPLAAFSWDTLLGVSDTVSWSDKYEMTANGYAVLYRAWWNVPSDADYGFLVNVDDFGLIVIDGVPVLSSTAVCRSVATNNVHLTAGVHELSIVLGNSSGKFGAVSGITPGIAYSAANALLQPTEGTPFADPGDGSVLTPLPLADGGPRPLVAHLVATNGAATVDASALGVSTLRLQGGLRAAGGTLTVAGVRTAVFGPERRKDGDISYPVFDVTDADFTADGATGFVLTNEVTVTCLPNTFCSVAAGTDVALRGTNTLARFYGDDGALSLTDWDVYLLENTAVPETVPVRVGAGRTLRIKPCVKAGGWTWYGSSDGSFTNDVHLLDATACLRFSSLYKLDFHGSVTGLGTILQDGGVFASSSTGYVRIYADAAVTGDVVVAKSSTLVFMEHAFPGCETNTVRLAEDAVFALHPEGYATRPTTGYIHHVVGENTNATIQAGVNGHCEIGTFKGTGLLRGPDDGPSSFHLQRVKDCSGIWIRPGTRVTLGELEGPEIALRAAAFAQNLNTSRIEVETTSSVMPLKWINLDTGMDCLLYGTGSLTRVIGTGVLSLAPEARYTVGSVGAAVKVDSGAGTLAIAHPTDWRDKVVLWLDPTASDTLHNLTSKTGAGQVYTNGFKLIDAWYDRRPEQRDLFALNNRLWTLGRYDLQPQVYPYLVTAGGPNGLPYLSFGTYQKSVEGVGPGGCNATEARRLQFWRGEISTSNDGEKRADSYAVVSDVVWAMMVFGSQNGGGGAVLGASDGFFERPGRTLEDAVMKNANSDFLLDGVRINPTTTKFSGGWQLLSFVVGNRGVNALNWVNGYSTSGGQNYGEVILFGVTPTEEERLQAESYLAAKWGLAPAVYKGSGTQMNLRGAGTVEVAAGQDVTLEGSFRGTATLAGGTLTVVPGRHSATAADIPAEGRLAWFDPEATGALGMSTGASRPLAVRVLHGRDNAGALTTQTGAYYLLGTTFDNLDYDRRPWLDEGARGGTATKWLDFTNRYGEDKGNTLRLFQEPAPAGESSDTAAKTVRIRTAFVALDSSKGGGMPILDTVGANGLIKARTPSAKPKTPIWAANTAADVLNGQTRLDGVVVDGTKTGYSAHPEVLSLVTAANVPFSYVGFYGGDKADTPNVEIIGEMIFFSTALDEQVRADIEAYLMQKWTGALPAGYSDLRGARVTGTGTVKAASADDLPSLDGFTGSVTLGQTDFAFALDTRATPAVADALAVPGPLALPGVCAVTVTCAAKPMPGSYTLISGTGFANATDWTLTLAGAAGDAKCGLRVTETALVLDVIADGTMIIVR